MKEKISIIFLLILVVSCSDNKDSTLKCFNEQLNSLNINADIQKNNKQIEISLKKPYKTVSKDHQTILLNKLVCNCSEINEKVSFNIYLDKEQNIKKNSFEYSNVVIKSLKQKYSERLVLKKVHGYILENFDKKDIFAFDIALQEVFKNCEFKDQIYNISFLDLITKFEEEVRQETPGKAIITFILTYSVYKNNSTFEFGEISNHLKGIWKLVSNKNIDNYLEEMFGDNN